MAEISKQDFLESLHPFGVNKQNNFLFEFVTKIYFFSVPTKILKQKTLFAPGKYY